MIRSEHMPIERAGARAGERAGAAFELVRPRPDGFVNALVAP